MQTNQLRDLMHRYANELKGKDQKFFNTRIENDIAIVTFDTAGEKANKWSSAALVALYELIEDLESQRPKGLVFLSAKPSIFIAGADINEIRAINTEESGFDKARIGQELFNRWERLPFPTVAAIHGAALGGGCEFVLSCTMRVASDDRATQIGLPEVKLGVFPGWGGTQRLPRMIGLLPAMDIILAGKSVDGRKALKLGLVQDLCPKELLKEVALKCLAQFSKQPFDKFNPPQNLQSKLMDNLLARPLVFAKARKEILSKTFGHYPAPLSALEVMRKTYGPGQPNSNGYLTEAKLFAKCAISSVSKELVRLFFLSEELKKLQYPKGSPVTGKQVSRVGVLGAGVMGAGIAQVSVNRDITVFLRDISGQALTVGLSFLAQGYKKKVVRKSMTPREMDRRMALVHPVLEMSQLKNSEIIIEAIVENLEVKQKVFQELEAVVAPETLLASNTSTLSISRIGETCKRQDRVLGLHFFNPVDKMPLVEIIYTPKTSPEAVATALEYVKRIGKTPVICKDAPGFVVNRILGPYLNEAGFLAQSGVPLHEVDKAFLKFGMPMGPYRLMDEVGLDVCEKAGKILHGAFGDRLRPTEIAHQMVSKKHLGKKSGEGFYLYQGKRETFNPSIYRHLGLSGPSGSSSEKEHGIWIKRLIYPMINEAARVLSEGIVDQAQTVDIAMIFGTGFAPFRGGLLRWADSLGLAQVVDDLEELGHELQASDRYKPCAYLSDLAREGKGFYG